jgi:hypothetical protein
MRLAMKKFGVKRSTFSLSEGKAEGKLLSRNPTPMKSVAYDYSGGLVRETLSLAYNI